jgi:uncharacterized protein
MIKLLLLLVAGYAVLCGAAYLLQDRMIFYPQPPLRTPEGPHVEAVSVARPDATLHGWVVNADSGGPLLFYFGGNAEELSWQVDTFARLDATTVLVNYRGFGHSEGSPSVARLVGDARAVVAELQPRFGEGRPLILFGRSIGSGIAAHAAEAATADGVILMSPFRSLAHVGQRHLWFLPVRWLLRDDLDTGAVRDALPDRVLVLHGTRDDIVPDEETLAFVELLEPPPMVVAYPGGHNEPLLLEQIWSPVQAFVAAVGGRFRAP